MKKFILILCIASLPLLQGWFFFWFPVGGGGNQAESAFAKFREDVDRHEANRAVALAKGDSRWAWGAAWGAGSEDAAKLTAVQNCQRKASDGGISVPCSVYSVNGRVIYQEPPKEAKEGDPPY